jgi:hypothetical protein
MEMYASNPDFSQAKGRAGLQASVPSALSLSESALDDANLSPAKAGSYENMAGADAALKRRSTRA